MIIKTVTYNVTKTYLGAGLQLKVQVDSYRQVHSISKMTRNKMESNRANDCELINVSTMLLYQLIERKHFFFVTESNM